MDLTAACPRCQRSLQAPPALAGKGVKCPACGEQFRLPGVVEVPVVALAATAAPPSVSDPAARAGLAARLFANPRLALLVAAGVLGGLVLLVAGAPFLAPGRAADRGLVRSRAGSGKPHLVDPAPKIDHFEPAADLKLDCSGQTLLLSNPPSRFVALSGNIRGKRHWTVWDLSTGKAVGPPLPVSEPLALEPNGRRLVDGLASIDVTVLDVASGSVLWKQRMPKGVAEAAVFRGEHELIIKSRHWLQWFDLPSLEPRKLMAMDARSYPGCAFSAGGRYFAHKTGERVFVIDLESYDEFELPVPEEPPRPPEAGKLTKEGQEVANNNHVFCFSPDGQWLAASLRERHARLWNLRTHTLQEWLEGLPGVRTMAPELQWRADSSEIVFSSRFSWRPGASTLHTSPDDVIGFAPHAEYESDAEMGRFIRRQRMP